ncbi:unnamed protein product [Lactuca saligna]|uniref:Uncharacterized protein n=1 Tax=Lactuca saligna TaxID=75948 RepID=A0AA35VJM2_LACSI|nr:unnamed protein product [Lactuca saligna]
MPVPPSPISPEELFEEEEESEEDEPFKEEESPNGANDEVPSNSSSYHDSSSSNNPAHHTEIERESDSEPLHPVEVLSSTSSPSHQSFSMCVIGPC